MSSLAELPELVGFFSYSRRDDENSRGALSRLRAHIQGELRLQLGRNFRLWQDTAAIPDGSLWEDEIKRAIAEAVFFIPIVTPAAVASEHCRFEFESFLGREAALGRNDLVFPILYIRVPALEHEQQWRQDDLLKIVGTRQYMDWQKYRHRDAALADVGERVEQFCANIVEALRQPWLTPEERRRRQEAETQQRLEDERERHKAEAARQAEEEEKRKKNEAQAQQIAEERRRQEAVAKQRAEEDERQRQAEAAERQRAEEERRGREAEAKKRADQERAFAAAKRADSITAVDGFISAHPDSHLAGEANALRATLVDREQAFQEAVASGDPEAFKAFLRHYPQGQPADEMRKQLRHLERRHPLREDVPQLLDRERLHRGQLSRRAMLVGGGAIAAGAVAIGGIWLTARQPQPESTGPTHQLGGGADGGLIRTFSGHTNTIDSVAIAPDGRTAVSASFDKDLRVWDLTNGNTIRTLSGHSEGVTSVVIAPDGRTALSGSDDKTARQWDLATGNTTHSFEGHTNRVRAVAITPNGRVGVTASDALRLWDLATAKLIRTIKNPVGFFSVAIAPDSQSILAATAELGLFDLTTGSLIRTLDNSAGVRIYGNSVAIAPDGRTAVSMETGVVSPGSGDRVVVLWDIASGKRTRAFTGHTDGIHAVAVSPNGRLVASGGQDKTVRVWDFATGALLGTFTGHTETVTSLAIAPDGRTALSGSQDGTLKLWSLT
jgi:WD40 repeat protein